MIKQTVFSQNRQKRVIILINTHCIYIHRNKINNKVYIGQALDDKYLDRWSYGHGYSKQFFGKEIAKYGWNNFEHKILETGLDELTVNERERYWIEYYDATNPEKGYNIDPGGGGKSEETRQRMSESWQKDKKRKKEQSDLMIKLNKTLDRTGENNSMYGRTREDIKQLLGKKVCCIEENKIFDSMSDAARWIGNENMRSHIAEVCKGKRKTCKGYHWKFINNNFIVEEDNKDEV